MQMMGNMQRHPMMPPCTMSNPVSAPAKPLFPAAVAQVCIDNVWLQNHQLFTFQV